MLFYLYLNVVLGLGMIYVSLHNRTDEQVKLSDALLEYSLVTNSMFIYMGAAINAVIGRYIGFVRTNKNASESGLSSIALNVLFSVICFGSSIFALYQASLSSTIEQFRTYIPVSIWLLFYSLVLASSILFIGKPEPAGTAANRIEKSTTFNQISSEV
jgi:hypothetical protein